ncbi:hypothetical protein [Natrinema longum]|uniref:Uncharacterized protein n=1 Tax=Natrinema longum TaxID=370324 RepID=A0A8A2U337_9EURY|nr:hypothetical protein [Natrinema longum]MBZ6495025.1 hypothetical protein [Natrinema longum]QSW83680.1 hypothetical protein J0X27_09300 [Natrinema longum]
MRRSIVITVVLLVLAFLLVGGPSLLVSLSADQTAPATTTQTEAKPTPELVSLEDSESSFWQYLSAREGFKRTSPINVVVRGDTDDVERVLTNANDGDWSEINESEEEALPDTYSLTGGNESDNETEPTSGNESDNETDPTGDGEIEAIDENGTEPAPNNSSTNATDDAPPAEPLGPAPNLDWGQADGGTRYAYVDPGPNESGYWTTETRQLEDGDYYGQRYHIRLYESPNEDDDWVIMQTHSEHFDWFTLRHRVHGSQDAQTKVENDFMEHPRVDVQENVHRMYLDNRNSADADGWATVVELAGLLVVPTIVGVRTRRRHASGPAGTGESTSERVAQGTATAIDDHLTDVDRRRLVAAYARLEAGHVLLVFTILALYLGVRMGGLALERQAGFLTPHQIAALLYPVIGIGIPVATYLLARGLTRRLDAAVVAAGSLAVAIWLDYSLLGVNALPVDVVLQRMLVVVALGLIAAGAAKRATRRSKFNDMLLVGTVMWVLVLVGTLFGYV